LIVPHHRPTVYHWGLPPVSHIPTGSPFAPRKATN
jgi:hypothetical protein